MTTAVRDQAYLNTLGIRLWVSKARAPLSCTPWQTVRGSLEAPCVAFIGPVGTYKGLSPEGHALITRLDALFISGTLAWAEYEALESLEMYVQAYPDRQFLYFTDRDVRLPFCCLPSVASLVTDAQAKRRAWDLLKKHCSTLLQTSI